MIGDHPRAVTHRAEPGHRRPRRASRRGRLPVPDATTVASTLLIALGIASIVAALLGVRLVPVLTGSMTPYAPTGSLAVSLPVDGSDLAVGDVVAFRPPATFQVSQDRPIMHRVTDLDTTGPDPWLATKGDANPDPDPWRITLDDAQLTRTVLVLPHLGHLAAGGRWAVALLLLGAVLLWAVRPALRRDDVPCTCPSTADSTAPVSRP